MTGAADDDSQLNEESEFGFFERDWDTSQRAEMTAFAVHFQCSRNRNIAVKAFVRETKKLMKGSEATL